MRWRRIMLRKMRWRIMKLRMMMWRGRKMMMLRRRTDPKTEDHTLWELAQSKCTSTFQKSHCIRKFTGKMPRPRWSPERGHTHTHTLCEPEQSKCMSTFHKSHLEIYRKNAAAQKRDRHFVRASSIEMHVNMLQEPHYTEIYRKNAAAIRGPDWAQNADTHTHTLTLCEPAQSKCMSTFHKSHFIRKIKGKMLWPSWSTLIKHQLLHLP